MASFLQGGLKRGMQMMLPCRLQDPVALPFFVSFVFHSSTFSILTRVVFLVLAAAG